MIETKVLDLNKIKADLELFKAIIEWEYPLDYQLKLDEVIKIIEEVGKE